MQIDTKLNWYGDQVTRDLERRVGHGIGAAAKFLSSRIEEAISVKAPTKQYTTASGKTRFRATTRATPGAPPRVVSGNLKRSIGWELVVQRMAVAKVGVFSGQVKLDLDPGELEPWKYGAIHEAGTHKFIMVRVNMYQAELERICAGQVVTMPQSTSGFIGPRP